MFTYDPQLLACLATSPLSIPDVLSTMQAIDALTVDGDGLKWFNRLYFQVTQAVEDRVSAGGFTDAAFLSQLDVQFAQLYFNALKSFLLQAALPECWDTLFTRRGQVELARIQFALAGVNAHINHDLPEALVATCAIANVTLAHGTVQYNDYTSLNSTLDSLIEEAKRELDVRLLGDALPEAAVLEDTIAAWSVSAAREAAWCNAELLWHLRGEAVLSSGFEGTLDGMTTLVSKSLLVAIP
jgi:Family of unknown function (DUF5995)